MAQAVYVEVYGERVVEQELYATGDAAVDFTSVWPEIISKLEQAEREQFDTDGARGPSGRWAPLDPTYAFWKWTHHLNMEILRASDAMYLALTGNGPSAMREATPTTLAFGAYLPEFRIQQDPPEDANFRVRYPIDLTETDKREIANILMDWIIVSRPSSPVSESPYFSSSPSGKRFYNKRGPGGRFVKRNP